MFNRRTLLFGVAALALLALGVTAGKGGGGGKPPPPPPPAADPAILYSWPGDSGGREVWVMNDDGSNQASVITYADDGLYVHGPQRWSSDNSRFLFLGRPVVSGQPLDLYIADSDGSNVTKIIDNEFVDGGIEPLEGIWDFDWSPDDECIFLSGHATGDAGPDIYAVRLDGTEPVLVQLTDTAALMETPPCVTPDGKYVLFGRAAATTGQDYLGRVIKATLGTGTNGDPVITAEECITDFTGGPLEGKNCGLVSLDPTGSYALVSQGYYLRNRWVVPLGDLTTAWQTSLTDAQGSWLDSETVVYKFQDSRNNWFFATFNVLSEEGATIASFGKRDEPGEPYARR